VVGISSFERRSRARPRASGVALWSSARRISSVVAGLPGGRIIERRNRRGEPITEEQPAPPDPPRWQIAATCELIDGGARDAEQVGHLPGRHDICACQRARGWRSHLPKRGPEPPKQTPGADFGLRLLAYEWRAGVLPHARVVRRPATWRAATFRAFRHHANGVGPSENERRHRRSGGFGVSAAGAPPPFGPPRRPCRRSMPLPGPHRLRRHDWV
jgi:hypothetical protein